MGTLRCTCATAPRRGPLPKLLWADLLVIGELLKVNFASVHYVVGTRIFLVERVNIVLDLLTWLRSLVIGKWRIVVNDFVSTLLARAPTYIRTSRPLNPFSPTLFLIVAKMSLPKRLAPDVSNPPLIF